MKTAYICSPYSGDTKRNKAYARELTLNAIKDGYAPITPHLYITECLNDNEPLERDLGLQTAINLLKKCDAIYIGRKFLEEHDSFMKRELKENFRNCDTCRETKSRTQNKTQ